jgi:integrase
MTRKHARKAYSLSVVSLFIGTLTVLREGGLKMRLLPLRIPNYTWHTNRHTFASRLVMAGVDLCTVQELLGHKSITTTMRYAHLAPIHQLAAVQRLCPVTDAQVPVSLQKRPTDTTTSTAAI